MSRNCNRLVLPALFDPKNTVRGASRIFPVSRHALKFLIASCVSMQCRLSLVRIRRESPGMQNAVVERTDCRSSEVVLQTKLDDARVARHAAGTLDGAGDAAKVGGVEDVEARGAEVHMV